MKPARQILPLGNTLWFSGDQPVENLGLIRIWIGFSLLLLNFSQFASLLSVDFSGPDFTFTEPIWYFKWLGITHSDPLMSYLSFFVLQLATIFFMVGLKTRSSIVMVMICIFYLKGVRDSAAGDVHHRYLIWMNALLMLLLSRANEVFAVDNFFRRKITSTIEKWEASWPVKMMQIYICFFYFISAVAKVRVSGLDWVLDGTPIQKMLLTKAARWNFETLPLTLKAAHYPLLAWFGVLFTLALEFGFPLILLVKSTRVKIIFFLLVTLFHLTTSILAGVGFWAMPLVFLVFFDLTVAMKKVRMIKWRLGN